MNKLYQAFSEARKSVLHGGTAVICRIVKSEGSSPRKAGALMCVTSKGASFGTIGGGDLELYCIELAREVLESGKGYTREFRLDSSKNDDVSMICGGNVTVEFIFLSPETDLKVLEKALGLDALSPRVWIFGAGHVGSELCPLLEHLGFRVIMVDDRPSFADPARHPEAERCILGSYSDISYADISKDDYVVIMTHGHLGDRQVLLQACRINPTYIGCIGSRKKIAVTNAFLSENGISRDVISSVHSPIGIELYGDAPEEIAVSVAAELIRHRALSSV